MADEFKVLLGAELSKNIDIQSEIDKIKGLHLNIDSVRINKDVINTVKAEISKTGAKLNLDFNVDTNSVVRQAQTATQQVQQIVSGAVQRTKFDQIFKPTNLNDAAKEAEKYFRTISKTVSVQEQLGDDKGLRSFTISLKNADGLVEQLRYNLKSIADDTGKVTDKYFEYAGGSINDNGIIQQFTKISAKADDLSLKLAKVKTAYSDMNAPKAIKNTEHVSALSAQYEKVNSAINAVRSADDSTFSSMVSNANREIAALESLVTQYKNAEYAATSLRTKDIATIKVDETNSLDAFAAKMERSGHYTDELRNNVAVLRSQLSQVFDASGLTAYLNGLSNLQTRFKSVDEQAKKNTQDMRSLAQAQSLALEKDRVKSNLERILSQNTAMTKGLREQFQLLLADIDNVDTTGLTNIKKQISTLTNEMKSTGKYGPGFVDKIKENVSAFTNWFVIGGAVSGSVRSVKQMVSNVKLLDDSLLELNKVSDLSANGLKKVTKEAYELGSTVGKTGTQVINATTEFKRAGYDLQSSMNMAESALIMTNVAEGIDNTADAAGTLISVLKGYNMEASETMSIVDRINQVSNTSPIGFDEIAEGLERVAGTLAQSGTSIDQAIGLITAGYAQLRNVEKVSTSLVTLSARLRGVGEDGEVIDGLSAKLQEDFGKIGVAIEDEAGNLRNLYSIMSDYSKVLPTLTSKQKQYYAELAAGKRNVTTWNAITQQFQDAEYAVSQSLNSVGSASVENQKYLDSLSGRLSMLQSSFQNLSNTVISSDFLKSAVDSGTTLITVLDTLIDKLGILPTIGIGTGAFALIKNLGWLTLTGLERQDIKIA